MPGPNEITPPQLLRLIGTPQAPVIVDVCIDADVAAHPFHIPGAIRHPWDQPDALKIRIDGQPAAIVCQKGLKLSQGVAAHLRADGCQADFLTGGMLAWRDLPAAPRIPLEMLDNTSLWVTRHRPKIDRIACPWLIRRFVDRGAKFLFVAPGQVADVAARFGAQPFDIENTFWSHRDGNCTFDTMLDAFQLRTEALDRLSTVVRAADTNRHDLAPEAAGLLAFSVGLSRQYRDDTAQLAAGLHFYDALYRWARDGAGEGHDWPADRRP